jgi:hypothetical protein
MFAFGSPGRRPDEVPTVAPPSSGEGDTVRTKPPFLYWALLWGLGSVVGLMSIGVDILRPQSSHAIGRDFANLYTAGRLVLEGRTYCAFDVDCFRLALMRHADIVSMQNYSYPPHALFIATPFSIFPYYLSLALWTVLGAAFFIWVARRWLPEGLFPILAALTPAGVINIWNGHYGFLYGGLWLLSFQFIGQRPVRSGIAAGLLTFKPHLGLFIGVLMLTKRRALVAAITTTFLLIAASALVFGWSTWDGFLAGTLGEQVDILTRTTGDFYFRMMPSAYVVFGTRYGVIAQCIFALAAMMLLVRARRLDAFGAATATFLVVPYVFNYDMTVACLGYGILLYRSWSQLSVVERAALSLAFLVPEITYLGYVVPMVIPPVLLSALYVQLRHDPIEFAPTSVTSSHQKVLRLSAA